MIRGFYVFQMECIYRNGSFRPGASKMLDTMKKLSVPFLIVTEQSGSESGEIVRRMQEAGCPSLRKTDIYTGVQAAADYLNLYYPRDRKVLCLGRQAVRRTMEKAGFIEDSRRPQFIIAGLDREMTYADYNEVFHCIEAGAKLVSVDDRIVQYSEGEPDLGNGSFVRMLAQAAGTKPVCCGRGSRICLEMAARRLGIEPSGMIMVGNDFEKDLIPAIRMHAMTFLVTEGRDILHAGISEKYHPDYIVETVDGIVR